MVLLQEQPRRGLTLRGLVAHPRKTVSALVNHPVTDVIVMLAIIASVVLLVIEESMVLPSAHWATRASEAITMFFAVELTLRFIVAKKKSRFFRRYWPDILAVLPLLRPIRFFRFLRLLRLFRLFQLGVLLDRRVSMLRGLVRVNFYFLWAIVVFTVIVVLGSAVMGFMLEHGAGNDFRSLEDSFWWAVYTIIAGEPIGGTPQTVEGRALLAMMMLSGMGIFAVFTGVVSASMITRLQNKNEVTELDIDELDEHIIIFGYNAGVPALLTELAVNPELRGVPILLVNELEERPDLESTGYRSDLVYFLQGDYTQVPVLQAAGVQRASRAVVVADDVRSHNIADRDARTLLTTLAIEHLNKDIFCVVELMNEANKETLKLVEVEAVVMRSELSGRALASACRHPHLMDVMMNLMTMHRGEVLRRLPGPRVETTFGELLSAVKASNDVVLIGVEQAVAAEGTGSTDPGGKLTINPPSDLRVGPGDSLVVIGARG